MLQIAFNGTEGRLDIRNFHNQPWEVPYGSEFRITKTSGETRTMKIGGKEGINVTAGGEEKENAIPGFAEKREGHIVLQDHAEAAWFRNIKIRRLIE